MVVVVVGCMFEVKRFIVGRFYYGVEDYLMLYVVGVYFEWVVVYLVCYGLGCFFIFK